MHNLSIEQLGQIVDRHGAALELFARQWTNAAAADVVQAAFVKLATNPLPSDQIIPWLYRVVRNGAISAARSESRRKRHEATGAQVRDGWFVSSTDDRLDAIEAAKELGQLPQIEREVLIARLWGGLSFHEIAELLEISPSSAHRYYVAGLGTLRQKFGVTWLKKNS